MVGVAGEGRGEIGGRQPQRLPWIIVIGFPKSGTSTIQRAFERAGLTSVHWVWRGQPVGRLVYDGWFDRDDPLAHFSGVDAITQMDYCIPAKGLNYWPNLDIALLVRIRRLHPEVRFILNFRTPEDTARSFLRWYDLAPRVTQSSITGLPIGRGRTGGELARWMSAHIDAVRSTFAADPRFLELDITAGDARERLSGFLGIDLPWWGVANANERGGR